MDIEAYILSGIIESYVLGLADAEEVLELEQLSITYLEIQAAITTFEASLEATALANAITPASETKNKIMLAFQDEFAPKDTIAPTQQAHQPELAKAKIVRLPNNNNTIGNNFYKYVAAAVLLLVTSSFDVYFYTKYKSASNEVVALLNEKNLLTSNNTSLQAKYQEVNSSLQLVSDTNLTKVALKGIPGKEGNLATVFWDNKSKEVYLYTNNLPKAPTGKQYQLWALVNGKPIDAGVIENCNGVCKQKNTQKAEMFAITLENAGGSPTPNLSQLYVIGKVS